MKKIMLLILFLSTFWGHSQVKGYTFSQTTAAYIEIAGTALGNETSDAQMFVDPNAPLGGTTSTGVGLPIGFTFTFNGYAYDSFAVCTDGWISLGSSALAPNSVNCTVTDATAPLSSLSTVPSAELSAKIAALAKNLQAQSGSTLTFATMGQAPNRVLVVQWKKYRRSGITGDDFNFQIRLNETSNTVSIAYGSFVNATSASTFAYQVGMRAEPTAVASNFATRKSTTGWTATVAGTAASDTVLMSDLIAPSSGLTFIWAPPTCGSAKGLVGIAITSSGVTLNWGAYTPTPASYEYIVSTSATLPLATVSGTATTDLTAAVSGLNANTNYNVFIRTKCGTDFTTWIAGPAFKTPCPDVTTYFDDFDSSVTYILPNCWDKAGTGSSYVTPGSQNPMTAPNCLSMYGSATAPAYAIMPPMSNLQAGTNRLRFSAYSSTVGTNTLDVGYFSSSDASTFVLIQKVTLPGITAATAQNFVVTPGPLPVGVKSLVFKNSGNLTGGTSVYIDDVIYEPTPSCADISSTTVSAITHNSVNFSWTKSGSETEWQYAYGPSTVVNPNSLTPMAYSGATTSIVISGLNSSTKYRLWIRPKCNGTDFGAWKGSLVFATTCAPITQFVENFDASTNTPACWTKMGTTGNISTSTITGTSTAPNALSLYADSATSPALFALPPLSNTGAGTYRLRFRAKGSVASSKLDIGYFTNMSDPNSFVLLQTVTINSATSFDSYIVGLGTDPKSPNLAFRNPGAATYTYIYIDDVTWEPIPSCPAVKAFAAANVMSTTASFGWTAGGAENAWQYAIGDPTLKDPLSLTPVTVSTNVANVSGLLPVTSYKIWVRSKCSDTSFGSWMDPLAFKTSCVSTTDFAQNFDAGTTMPSCWSQVGSGSVSVSAFTGVPSSPNMVNLYSSSTTAPAILAVPPVSNAADHTHRLRFKVLGTAVDAKLEVGYLLNFSDPASFVPMYTHTVTQTNFFEYKSVELDFGDDPSSDYLAFRNAGATPANFYLDDIVWEKKPTCADVSNVIVTGSAGSTASVGWTANASLSKWEYAIGATSVSDPNTLTPVEVSSAAITISGLTPVTTYRFWVRSKCSAINLGTWMGPYLITTTCSSVTEFTQNFDASGAFPSCWNKVGTGGSAYVTSAADAPSKSNVLSIYSSDGSVAVVAMPAISNNTATDHILRFKYRGVTAGTVLEVGYLTNLSDPASFVPFKSIVVSSTTAFQTQIVSLHDALSNILAFRNTGGTAGSIYIDDVSWDFVPTAAPVCGTGITAVPNTCGNLATVISWSAVSGADGYKVTIGSTPGGSDLVKNEDVSGTAYAFSGNLNTKYYYTVKPYNSFGVATGCLEQSFTTQTNGCYCTSTPAGKDGQGITAVKIGGSAFLNGGVVYADYTTNPVNLAQGVNSNLQISFYTNSVVYKTTVFVDFNDNYNFEASEVVSTGASAATAPATLDASFMMPATANLGMHRMRIRTSSGPASTMSSDPCYTGSYYGVTLDFKVNVVASIANDEASGAIPLTVGPDFASNAVTGTNVNSTGSLVETIPACGGYNGMDVWYKAVVPASGNLTFEVNSVSGGITNTAAAAYNVYLGSLALISCDDSSSTAGDNQPKISLNGRTAGEMIYFRVWENGGDAYGEFKASAYDATAPVLGVDGLDSVNFSYYPNPVTDVLNLSFNKEIGNVSVLNLLGQQVISKSLNSNQGKIDLSGLSRGAYLVKVAIGNQSKTIKVIKE